MNPVLILDGQQRSALAATRSLGKRGVKVHVADVNAPMLAGSSRHAAIELTYPDPRVEASKFIEWVHDTARTLGVQVIMPMTDVSTMLLAPEKTRFGDIRIACAQPEAYDRVSDKAKLLDLAHSTAVTVPATTVVSGKPALASLLRSANFPLVLKPARSKLRVQEAIISTSVHIACSYEDAMQYVNAQTWLDIAPCLVQGYIEGQGAGVFAFYDAGRPASWFAHKRIREKPPSGGVSVLSESVAVNEQIRSAAERLLSAVGWSGAAMVEFKIGTDGTPYLMEINGRMWGSLQLAIDSGIDFPWLAYQQALGESVAHEATEYRIGRRLRWLFGDLDNLLIQIRSPSQKSTQKLAAAGNFFGAFFDLSSRQEVFRWSDPGPAALEAKTWFKGLA